MFINKELLEQIAQIKGDKLFFYNLNENGDFENTGYYDENTLVTNKDMGKVITISKFIANFKENVVPYTVYDKENKDKIVEDVLEKNGAISCDY